MPLKKGLNFFSRFIRKVQGRLRSSPMPSLRDPLEGITHPPTLPDFIPAAETLLTTLDNGMRIASQSAPGPCATVGLFVECGSVYEGPATRGVTHLLHHMAFKSTRNRSHEQIVGVVEAIGAKVTVSASREVMGYMSEGLKTYFPHMVELLVDNARNPAFLDSEVNDQVLNVKKDLEQALINPHSVLIETIHSAGYQGCLSNSLLAPEYALGKLNNTLLKGFVAEHYTAPRMVLVAYGVEHQQLLEIAVPLLADMPPVDRTPAPISQYQGGEFRQHVDSAEITHFAVAFESPGGWLDTNEALTLTILERLMGDGVFSARGPAMGNRGPAMGNRGPAIGKRSRLYDRVIRELGCFQSLSTFNNIHNSSSIFGIQGTTKSEFMPLALEVISKELNSVSKAGEVSQAELDRAKKATKLEILMNLESGMSVSEDIGQHILSYGERKPVKHLLDIVDKVTLEDVASISTKLISSPPTLSSYGDVSCVPSYEFVKKGFARE